jgi:transketolase
VQSALNVANALQTAGIEIAVFSVPSLQPLDIEPILASAGATRRLMTLEDHGRGGLGTIIAESVSQRPRDFDFRMLSYQREPATIAGRQEFLRSRHGLDEAHIMAAIRAWVSG